MISANSKRMPAETEHQNPVGLIRRLLFGSMFYSLAIGIEALIPFALLPFLTRFLSPAEYGLWIIWVSLFSFMRPVLGLTLQDAVRMRFFEMDRLSLSKFFASATCVSIAFTQLFILASLIWESTFESWTKFPGKWIWTAILASFLHGVFYTALAILQFRNERRRFTVAQGMQMSVTLAFSFLLVTLGLGWSGVVLARLTALLVSLYFIARLFLNDLDLDLANNFRVSYCKELLWFGLRYLPTGLVVVIVPLCDRLFVAHMVGLDQAGFFGIGALFGNALWILICGFLFAWQPSLFRLVSDKDPQRRKKAASAAAFFYLVLPIAGLAIIVSGVILAPLLLGEKFLSAQDYIIWLVVAMIAQGYFQHNQTCLHAKRRITVMSVVSLFAIIVNVPLNWWFIGSFGGIGAAWATAMAYFLAAIINGVLVILLIGK